MQAGTLDPAAAESGLGWVAYEGWHGVANNEFTAVEHAAQPVLLPRCPQVNEMTLGHTLRVLAPVLPGGWVYLGEQDKLVAVSGPSALVRFDSLPLLGCAVLEGGRFAALTQHGVLHSPGATCVRVRVCACVCVRACA